MSKRKRLALRIIVLILMLIPLNIIGLWTLEYWVSLFCITIALVITETLGEDEGRRMII